MGGDQRKRRRRRLLFRHGPYCMRCRKRTRLGRLTLDHVVPQRDGGSNNIENLQLLCCSCHSEVDNKLPGGSYPEKEDYRP